MPHWRKTLDIKQVLYNDALSLEQKAEGVAAVLDSEVLRSGAPPFMLDELQDAGHDNDVEWFDSVLEQIYDWADSERIWLGVRP